MAKSSYEKGKIGEKIAVKFLENKGFSIIITNYRTSFGEIDIIAKDGEYIVFIEVKLRNSLKNGLPREAVNKSKQKNIIAVAEKYISENQMFNVDFRFDVIEVLENSIIHIENAFW